MCGSHLVYPRGKSRNAPVQFIAQNGNPNRAAWGHPIWEAEPLWAMSRNIGSAGSWHRLGWTAFGSKPRQWQHYSAPNCYIVHSVSRLLFLYTPRSPLAKQNQPRRWPFSSQAGLPRPCVLVDSLLVAHKSRDSKKQKKKKVFTCSPHMRKMDPFFIRHRSKRNLSAISGRKRYKCVNTVTWSQ